MRIEKIDNGYLVRYAQTVKSESDFDAREYHTYAFNTFKEAVDFIGTQEHNVEED